MDTGKGGGEGEGSGGGRIKRGNENWRKEWKVRVEERQRNKFRLVGTTSKGASTRLKCSSDSHHFIRRSRMTS